MGEETVSKQQAEQLLHTGLKWQTALFVCVYRKLSERLGPEEARSILRESTHQAGVGMGRDLAKAVSRHDALGIKESWEVLYGIGSEGVEEASPTRFVFKGSFCCSYELMKRWGLSTEEIDKLADCFCIADAGFVEGFNPEMEFEHTERLMKGDAGCRWVHTIETPSGLGGSGSADA